MNKKIASTVISAEAFFCVVRLFLVLRFFGFFFSVIAAVDEVDNDVDGYDDEVEEVNYQNIGSYVFAYAQLYELGDDAADVTGNYEKNEGETHSFCRFCLVVFDNRKRP